PCHRDLTSQDADSRRGRFDIRSSRTDAAVRVAADRRIHAAPGDGGEMGDPTPDIAHPHVQVDRIKRPPLGDLGNELGQQPVAASARDLVQRVADVQQLLAQRLGLVAREVDEPGRQQRAQRHRVAQTATGLLEIGHGSMGEPPESLDALVPGRPDLPDPSTGLAPPVAEPTR
ncbi:hypothetical protein BHE94_18930, partial [Bacillus pumilus]